MNIPYRIGHGYDAHRFASERRLILGGVEIAHEFGMQAHSDGDVILHALCDALLGAAGMGDIGQHFPDSSKDYENIDSRILLRHVVSKLHEKEFVVGNTDITIVAQAPKMAPHLDQMKSNIAADLQIYPTLVNIKATTTEKMGFTGRSEGIACYAVVLIAEKSL